MAAAEKLHRQQAQQQTRIITDNGRACVSQCQNNNGFMNLCKSVSSLKFSKEDGSVKRTLSRTLRTLEVTKCIWTGFTTSEVRAALSSLNPSRATGPDKVNPELLRHLDTKADSFARQLFLTSRESTTISQSWRADDIRSDPKSGNDAQKLDSYRPIYLTSTIWKVMKRLVINCVRYGAEARRLLSEHQAGKKTSCIESPCQSSTVSNVTK